MPIDLLSVPGVEDRPFLLLSPHLDDAWLSAAGLLQQADCEVWTVFAGEPDPPVTSAWDITCGFTSSRETMAARREEDRLAFCGSRAGHRQLPFLDAAYSSPPQSRRSAAALQDLVQGWVDEYPDGLLAIPVGAGVHVPQASWQRLRDRIRPATDATSVSGSADDKADGSPEARQSETASPKPSARLLGKAQAQTKQTIRALMHADHQRRRRKAQRRGMAANPDHLIVRTVGLNVALGTPGTDVVFWEDLPYLWHEPGADQARRMARHSGRQLIECTLSVDLPDKFDRLQSYRSQLDHLDAEGRLSQPGHLPAEETYWFMHSKAGR